MNARTTALKTSGILVAALTATLALAPAASASYTDCPSTKACLWTSEQYPGSPNGNFGSDIVLGSSNNKINSIVNNGTQSIAAFYDANDKTGINITLNNPARGGQSRDPILSNGTDATGSNWANRISSAKFI